MRLYVRRVSVDAVERETEKKKKRRGRERLQLVFSAGVFLYSCSDIAHKQPPWGIKCKDLDSENGALVCSSAESLLCSMIGVSLDHHVLAPRCLSSTRGD